MEKAQFSNSAKPVDRCIIASQKWVKNVFPSYVSEMHDTTDDNGKLRTCLQFLLTYMLSSFFIYTNRLVSK